MVPLVLDWYKDTHLFPHWHNIYESLRNPFKNWERHLRHFKDEVENIVLILAAFPTKTFANFRSWWRRRAADRERKESVQAVSTGNAELEQRETQEIGLV